MLTACPAGTQPMAAECAQGTDEASIRVQKTNKASSAAGLAWSHLQNSALPPRQACLSVCVCVCVCVLCVCCPHLPTLAVLLKTSELDLVSWYALRLC